MVVVVVVEVAMVVEVVVEVTSALVVALWFNCVEGGVDLCPCLKHTSLG